MRKNGMDMHTFSRTNILSFTKAFECRVIKLSPDLYGSFFLPKVSSFLPSLRILAPQKQYLTRNQSIFNLIRLDDGTPSDGPMIIWIDWD